MKTVARGVATLALCHMTFGCTELDDLGADCGNGVIDVEREDCDSTDPGCRPPGTDGECRYDCSIGDDGTRRACPDGMGCGTDSICRTASGQFERVPTTFPGLTLRLERGDLDGDGAADIIANQFGGVQVIYFESDGSVASVTPAFDFQFSPVAAGPLARHADAPDAPDTLVNARGNLSVYLGQTDRTLSTKSYASIPVEVDALRYVVLEGLPTDPVSFDYGGSEIVAAVASPNGSFLLDVFGGVPLFELDLKLSDVARGLTTANLLSSSPCDELVVTAAGRDHVAIYEICHKPAERWVWKTANNRIDLDLPGASKIAELPMAGPGSDVGPETAQTPLVIAAHLNADEHLDLLTLVENAVGQSLAASYGVGNGTFHSSAILPEPVNPGDPVPAGNGAFGLYQAPYGAAEMPLAVGELTEDGKPDFVTSFGVVYSTDAGDSCFGQLPGYDCLGVALATPLSKAVIEDFNANGISDVVALDANARTLHFLNGTGDGFVPSSFSSSGFVRDFAIGDFDGDLLHDIALHEVSLTQSGVLSVLYARPFATPTPPVTLAKFAQLVQIGAGLFDIAGLDAIADIGVLSRNDSGALAAGLFSGSSDRRVQSPFTLFFDDELAAAARAAVVGQFDSDPHADIAVSSGPVAADAGPGVEIDQHVRLWLLPSVGEAELDVNTTSHTEPLDDVHDWCGATLLPIDLDADGTDELVALSAAYAAEAPWIQGSIAVARAVPEADGKTRFQIASHALVDEFFVDGFATIECSGPVTSEEGPENPEQPGSTDGLPPMSAAWALDVNRDGHRDVLTLAYGLVGDASFEPRLVVYLNDGAGSLDLANPLRLAVELPIGKFNAMLTGVAPIQGDSDPEPELLLVMSPLAPSGPDGGAFLADLSTLDVSTGTLAPPIRVHDVPSLALTVGDFNGDGVDDFATSTVEGIELALGTAVLR